MLPTSIVVPGLGPGYLGPRGIALNRRKAKGRCVWKVEESKGLWAWKTLTRVRDAVKDFVEIWKGMARWKACSELCSKSIYAVLVSSLDIQLILLKKSRGRSVSTV
ncbi:hypothetical protein Dimus_023688 [Dionaea muscipula]